MLKWLISISAILFITCQCFAQTAWVKQQSGLTTELRAVAFFDSLHGFAAGDSCVKTTDGGKHWTLVPEITNCKDIKIDKHGTIWFAECADLAHSNDSGKTFIKHKALCVNRLASNGSLLDAAGGTSPNGWPIYRTKDSGLSWQAVSVSSNGYYALLPYGSNGSNFNLHTIVYSSIFIGIIVGDKGKYLNSQHEWDMATLLISADSGKTWESRVDPNNVKFPDQLFAAQSIDSLNFIVAGTSSYIAKIGINGPNGTFPYDIRYIIPLMLSNINDPIFYDVHFFNLNRGFVIGESGTIFYTENGGKGWSKIPSPVPGTLFRITFTDSSNGWIVGANGVILHTDNGGWVGGTSEVRQTAKPVSENSLSYDIDRDEWILRTQDNLNENPKVTIFSVLGVSLFENISCDKISDGEYHLPMSRMKLPSGFYIARFQANNKTFTLPLIQR